MPIELKYLVWSVALFFVMIMVQAIGSDREHGLKHNAGPRDGAVDKSLFVQRAKRANQNMIESLIMFAPLVIVAALTESVSSLTALGAALFFWGRVVYAPTYWFGVPWVRSLAWFVSIAGILMILWELLF